MTPNLERCLSAKQFTAPLSSLTIMLATPSGCSGTICKEKLSPALTNYLNFPRAVNQALCGLIAECSGLTLLEKGVKGKASEQLTLRLTKPAAAVKRATKADPGGLLRMAYITFYAFAKKCNSTTPERRRPSNY